MNQELNDDLDALDALLRKLDGKVFIEDGWGHRYKIRDALVMGRRTDGPFLSLKIEKEARHPDA